MILLIRFAVIYFLAATAWSFYMRDDLFFVGAKVLSAGTKAFGIMGYFGIALVFFAIWVWTKCESHIAFAKRIAAALVTLAFCCLFLSAFSSVKSSLPYTAQMWGLEPFFADPFLAEVDRLMHFGTDPWVWTHALTETLGWDNFAVHASIIYGPLWLILAFYLPAIMIFAGEDRRTMNHYVALYAFSWVILGNVFAMIGQSGGPIYFDNITETVRFADLHTSLASGSIANSWFGTVQPALWEAYISEDQAMGSGISAFPSLHLGMIMVVALYLAEKHVALRLFGIFMVVSVMFISVWVGYHYAIDGYFSIIAIYAAHVALKRWARTREDTSSAPNVSQDAAQNA
ncbi:unnamed protein product [Ectocarpus sp. 12 AP-2014]